MLGWNVWLEAILLNEIFVSRPEIETHMMSSCNQTLKSPDFHRLKIREVQEMVLDFQK